jgi:hypothetical protein
MDLLQRTTEIVQLMKEYKESWVAEHPDSPDMPIFLHFYRGDELVVAAQCPLDRDTALHAGHIGATGFNADAMVLTFEGYHSDLVKSPVTGKDWEHLEMQYLAQNDPQAFEKGWIEECLNTTSHERFGGYVMHTSPFRRHGTEVEWQEDREIYTGPDDKAGGLMFDYLQRTMSASKLIDLIRDDAETNKDPKAMATLWLGDAMAEDQRLFHTDVATVTALKERELVTSVILLAEEGSERHQLIIERFGEQAVVRNEGDS